MGVNGGRGGTEKGSEGERVKEKGEMGKKKG